jgi:hypothetical protein
VVAFDTGSVTVISVVPALTPEITPAATVATASLEEVHCRFGGVAIVPPASDAVTARVVVLPTATFGDAGEICSEIALTVTAADAVAIETGSVTVMVALPAATPVTTPAATVAAAAFDDDHWRLAGVAIGLPLSSVAVTDRSTVDPMATDVDAGETCRTTAAVTVTVEVPLAFDTGSVAVIVAVPVATPVTTPPVTVATAGFELAHPRLGGVAIGPLASVAVTVRVVLSPTFSVGAPGETWSVIASTVTVAEAVAVDTGSVTVIVAVPVAMPVTTPPATVATAVLEDVHCKFGGGATEWPAESVAVTVNVVVLPTAVDADVGEIWSDAGGSVTVRVAVL